MAEGIVAGIGSVQVEQHHYRCLPSGRPPTGWWPTTAPPPTSARAGDRATNEPPVRHDQIVRLLTLRFADVGPAEDHVHDGLATWQQSASKRVPFVAMPP
ncbi:MAG TPA: hypothetical protein VF486_02605 [Actinomycetes bacterium]